MNTKAYYNKVIGENAGGIYILRFRDPELKGGFDIERYSHNMDFIESENLELDKRESLVKVFTTDSGLIFIKLGFDHDLAELSMLVTGFSTRNKIKSFLLYRSTAVEKTTDNVVVDYDINRRNIGMWISEINTSSQQEFVFLRISTSGVLMKQSRMNTQFSYRDVEHKQSCISNTGDAAMIFRVVREDKRVSDPSNTEHFLMVSSAVADLRMEGLGDHKYFLSSFDLTVNEYNGKFLIAGLYDFKSTQGAHGIVNYSFQCNEPLAAAVFRPFDRKFVSLLIGAKLEKDGENPENFKVRKIVPRNDGGHLMICEFFQISQQMETFYLNGVPQTSSKNVYNYNDLMFVSVDSSGEIEWRYNVNKRQNAFASLAYLQSIGVYVCEENINILYNDNSSQSNRVIHLKLSRNGKMEQKILLNSDNEYTAVVPLEGKQTGYHRFVTPALMNKQTLLLELIDDE